MSFGIRSPDLEAEGWNESDDENDEEEGSDADGDSIADTPTRSR
jgi:hypothetical protein